MEFKSVGIVGQGDMGKLYAKCISKAGFEVQVCDIPEKYKELQDYYKTNFHSIKVWETGFDVVRRSDMIIYSVEAENIQKVVKMYANSTKVGAIIAGQTSVKEPEIHAFEQYLPNDCHIITCHSMHGPNVDPKGQPLVIINHKCSKEAKEFAFQVFSSLQSDIVYLSWQEHDKITADTQAVTHLAFLSMGGAWKRNGIFPWKNSMYTGGIENVKVLTMLRIFGSKWHVYAGLAMLNPSAKIQIQQYAKSVSELFKLMIQEKSAEFQERVKLAGEFVFGNEQSEPLLLCDSVLDEFSLSAVPNNSRKPNSHLSLLAIVDCWYHLKLNPYNHMICQTPPFRLWLGITEYLFKSPEMLQSSINAALFDKSIRADDLEFLNSTQKWTNTIFFGSMESYKHDFEEISLFFESELDEGRKLSSEMIRKICKHGKV